LSIKVGEENLLPAICDAIARKIARKRKSDFISFGRGLARAAPGLNPRRCKKPFLHDSICSRSETSLIIREDRVWSRVLTSAMSEFFEGYYLSRGVKLLKKGSIVSLEGKDGVDVSLSSGCTISCDMVVAGVGASAVTELFAKSGLLVENGIVVNEYLETNQAGIFAAGDVANYVDKVFDKRRRVEHWDNAVSQGQYWAATVQGGAPAIPARPLFLLRYIRFVVGIVG
jgi:Pyridine nucleotide-disulphide oxidoreductase